MMSDQSQLPKIQAKKSLGQNFCVSDKLLNEVLSLLSPTNDDQIWEIGPGTGNLTSALINSDYNKIHVFEIDQRMEPILQKRFGNKINIHIGDALHIHTPLVPLSDLLICGNLPYYCGTPLVRRFMHLEPPPKNMVFVLQEEVVQKATASVNSKNYGFLSVEFQLFAQVSGGSIFSPDDFRPRPKIASQILQLLPYQLTPDEKRLRNKAIAVASVAFHQRRKMAVNVIKRGHPHLEISWRQLFEEINIPLTARAENISTQQYLQLATYT